MAANLTLERMKRHGIELTLRNYLFADGLDDVPFDELDGEIIASLPQELVDLPKEWRDE